MQKRGQVQLARGYMGEHCRRNEVAISNVVCQWRLSWSKIDVVILEKIPEIRRLSAEEKLMLLTELWDELTLNPDEVTLPPDQEDLLDQRWHDYQKDPSQGTPWEVVKARVRRGRP
jgi:putative addiction module component (TIGR02574 family)